METLIKNLKSKLKKLQDKGESEENLKIHITSWVLGELGYNPDDFDYEYKLCRRGKDRHADIYIPVQDGAIFIETKKYSKDLSEEDVLQLIEYLDMNSILWGILTNGRQYYLINNAIKIHNGNTTTKTNMSRVVLHIDIKVDGQSGKKEKYFKYFSKEYIFDKKLTNFYRDVAQYFASTTFKNERSQRGYIDTLYNFFDFYSAKVQYYKTSLHDDTAALEDITQRDVIEFFKAERPNGRPYKGGVPKTKCSHITSMFETLHESKYIRDNKVKNLLDTARAEFKAENAEQKNTKDILTEDNIMHILKWIENKKTPVSSVIFILAAYYGFDRSAIVEFGASNWDIIDFKKHSFKFKGKIYPLVTKLEHSLIQLQKIYKEKKVRANNICISTHGGKNTPVTVHIINSFFKEGIHRFDDENINWSDFNLQNIRNSLILRLYRAGCSLDEIAYLTGTPIASMIGPKMITEEMIRNSGEKSWKNGIKSGRLKHPFDKIFNS